MPVIKKHLLIVLVFGSLEDVDLLITGDCDQEEYGTSRVKLDCLLPNGAFIDDIEVDRWQDVESVKNVRKEFISPFSRYQQFS